MQIVNPYIGSSAVPMRPAGLPPRASQPVDVDERAAFDADKDEPSSFVSTAATAAMLAIGAFSSVGGSFIPSITQLTAAPVTQTLHEKADGVQRKADGLQRKDAITTPEQASRDIHIISHVDATETVIEPFATDDLGQLQKTTTKDGQHVTADVSIERHANPRGKLIVGGLVTAGTVAPFFIARKLAKKQKGAFLAIAITMAGVGGTYIAGSTLGFMHDGAGRVVSALADYGHAEGVWSGHREVHMADGQRTPLASSDSEKVAADDVSGFIARHMAEYPSGNTVVTLTGHGLMYRHVSGFSGPDFQKLLGDATTTAGRPIDIVVLESCLAGNLETLNSIYPHARYAVVSEESIAAGGVGQMLERSADKVAGRAVTPRELASTMLAEAKDDNRRVPTLAVVDLAEVPHVNEALDRLGASLTAEVNDGRTTAIRAALDKTAVYPFAETAIAKKLSIGDLRQFAENIQQQYAQNASPRAAEIREQAQQVIDAMKKAVVGFNGSPKYQNQGGITVQLPGMNVGSLEKKSEVLGAKGLSSYADADSPEHWRSFVNAMSEKMQAPTLDRSQLMILHPYSLGGPPGS